MYKSQIAPFDINFPILKFKKISIRQGIKNNVILTPSFTSSGLRATCKYTCSMVPINSLTPVTRFFTGLTRRAGFVKINKPGYCEAWLLLGTKQISIVFGI